MRTNIKIIYFIFILQIIGWGVVSKDHKIAVFGSINLLFLFIWLLVDNDFENIKQNIKKLYVRIFYKFSDEEERNSYKNLWQIGSYFIKHYLFVLSFFILFIAFLNKYFFSISNINLSWALFRFILFTILNIKNIYNGEIYFGYKKLYQKDLYFVLSIIIIFRIFSYIQNIEFYTRIGISFLLGSFYYFIMIKVSGFDKIKKIFSMLSVKLYLFFDLIIIIFFLINFIPEIKYFFVEKQIVYKEKIIEKPVEKIVYIYSGNQIFTGNVFTGGKILTGYEYIQNQEKLTYYDVIPYLVDKYKLNSQGLSNIVFDNISINDPKYEAFKIVYHKKIFGTSSDPKSILKCKNLIVIIGLIEGWNIEYTQDTIFDKYWERAQRNGMLKKTGCKIKDDPINYENLIF